MRRLLPRTPALAATAGLPACATVPRSAPTCPADALGGPDPAGLLGEGHVPGVAWKPFGAPAARFAGRLRTIIEGAEALEAIDP
jgi:hypothetical protein